MRRLAPVLAIAIFVPSCLIGPRPVRHAVNATLLGGGATLAAAAIASPCATSQPGALDFDRLCQGLRNGEIAFGVTYALAGLAGFVMNAFDDGGALDSHGTK